MAEPKVFARACDNPRGGFDVVFTLPSGREERYTSVFCRRRDAEEFVERVNRLGVSELHLDEIIEDALT